MSGFRNFSAPGGRWQNIGGGAWQHPGPLQIGGRNYPFGGMIITRSPPVRTQVWQPKPIGQKQAFAQQLANASRARQQAERQARQAQARQRAANEALRRQRDAERTRRQAEQRQRAIERAEEQTQWAEQRRFQRAMRENRLRHQREQRQLAERLRNQRRIRLADTTYRKDKQTRTWLKPGQTVEQARVAAHGGDPTCYMALNKATRSAEKTEPFWTRATQTMTVIMSAWGAGIMGGLPLAGEAAVWANDIVKSMSDVKVETSPVAKRSDPDMRTVNKQMVLVRGAIATTKMDKLVREMAEGYAKRVAAVEESIPKKVKNRRAKVGRIAEQLWRKMDVPKCARKHGINPNQVTIEPLTGATGQRGGLTRYDLGIEGRRPAMIEVKTSGYRGERVMWQLQTHLIGIGEGTATGMRPGDYYRIVANERKIYKWRSEDVARPRANRPGRFRNLRLRGR